MTTAIQTTQDKKDRFIEMYSRDEVRGNVTLTCEATGIGRKTYYDWLEKDPNFRELVKEQKLKLCDDMEQVLISRGVEKSDAALIFWLKHNHENYKEGPVVIQQFNVGGKMDIEFVGQDESNTK